MGKPAIPHAAPYFKSRFLTFFKFLDIVVEVVPKETQEQCCCNKKKKEEVSKQLVLYCLSVDLKML